MRIAVSRAFSIGYTFVVEKDKEYEKTEDIIEACLQLEQALIVQPSEEDKKEDK